MPNDVLFCSLLTLLFVFFVCGVEHNHPPGEPRFEFSQKNEKEEMENWKNEKETHFSQYKNLYLL